MKIKKCWKNLRMITNLTAFCDILKLFSFINIILFLYNIMTISKKTKKNNKYLSRKQFGGKDCKFPDIWENEVNGQCVRTCPEGTCPKYDIHGKFKCANQSCRLLTPAVRSLGNVLFNKASSVVSQYSNSYDGMPITSITQFGNNFKYFGPLRAGKPHGIGLAIFQNYIYYGNWDNGIINGHGNIIAIDGKFNYTGNFINNHLKPDRPTSIGIGNQSDGRTDCKFPNIWQNDDLCVDKCPSGKFSKYESSKFICDNRGESNGMPFIDFSDDHDSGEYYGPIDEDYMPSGVGLLVYDNRAIYYGEHQKGIRTHGILLYPDGTSFDGQFDHNGGIQGKLTAPDGTVMIGTFVNGRFNGKGKVIEHNGPTIEGDFVDNKFMGNGTIKMPNGRVYNYPRDEHLLLTPSEYSKEMFMISSIIKHRERPSITILVMLHGADISNSRCQYNPTQFQVRLVSAAKSGDPNKVYDENSNYLVDAYHIATNVFHLEENKKASSLQKLEKTIELFNLKSGPHYPVFPSDSLVNPLIDHLYSFHGEAIPYLGIYVIYDSMNDTEPFHRFPETTKYDFSTAKKLTLDTESILRSELINMYINKKYGIINIIDLSCRPRQVRNNLPENIRNHYRCNYKTANLSDPEESQIKL